MAKYNVRILVDTDSPFTFVDIALHPYILSLSVSCGGKVKDHWQKDGKATLLLDNSTGVFHPHATSSPFYEKLLTKRRVRIMLNGAIFWTGVIEQITPNLDTKKPTVSLELTQGLQNIKDIYLKGLVYEGLNGTQLLQALIEDNPFIPIGVDPVFVVGYSLIGDDLTLDYGAELVNEVFTDIVYTYASDTWDRDTSLYKALEELFQAEQTYAFLDRTGRLNCLPFWWVKTGTSSGTENVDNSATKAVFSASSNIVNEAIVGYYTREVLDSATVKLITRDVDSGEDFSLSPTTLETEQKRVILGNVRIAQGGSNVSILNWDARKVNLRGHTTGEDVTIQVTADILTTSEKSNVTRVSSTSLDKYRYRYAKEYKYKLLGTELAASAVAGRILTRYANPFTYIESMSFVDYYPYAIGDVVLLTSGLLPVGGSKHLILGEEHELVNDTLKTRYYMIGTDSAKVFIIDESLISGEDTIL